MWAGALGAQKSEKGRGGAGAARGCAVRTRAATRSAAWLWENCVTTQSSSLSEAGWAGAGSPGEWWCPAGQVAAAAGAWCAECSAAWTRACHCGLAARIVSTSTNAELASAVRRVKSGSVVERRDMAATVKGWRLAESSSAGLATREQTRR